MEGRIDPSSHIWGFLHVIMFCHFFNFRWVLNTIDNLNLKQLPLIVLLPLGTGNDLARSLGYGPGEDSSINVK